MQIPAMNFTKHLALTLALGLVAIYGQSIYEVAQGREGYSDSLTGLIFFLLAGRMFQRKSFDRLVFDRDYRSFFPLAVCRVRPADPQDTTSRITEERVALAQLAVGDRLRLRHGPVRQYRG